MQGTTAVEERTTSRQSIVDDLRTGWQATLALVATHLILSALTFNPTPHTGGDNAAYIALAHSLLEGQGYLELYDPATPPHTQYPPVFPAMLALATLLGLGSWIGYKIVVVLASGIGIGATYLWLRRRTGPRLALGVTSVLVLSPTILDLSHWVLSDVPFWALTATALWAFDHLIEETAGDDGVRKTTWAGPTLAVGATTLAYFTRSAGLPLVIAVTVILAFHRRWRTLVGLGTVLAPLALWWWLRARGLGGVDYVGQFWWVDPYSPELGTIGIGDLLTRVLENSSNYLSLHLPLLLTGQAGALSISLGILATLTALIGWVRRLSAPGVTELFFPLYLGLILVWPAVWSGERFLLPAYPLLLGYAAEASRWALDRWRPTLIQPLGIAALLALVLLIGPTLYESIEVSSRCMARYRSGDPYPCLDPAAHDFFRLADWTGAALPEEAVVISRKPRLFYGLSGRRGLIYPLSTDPEVFFDSVRESGARYIVLDQLTALTPRYIGPILEERAHAFCLLHTAEGGYAAILGILPEESWAERPGAPTSGTGTVNLTDCPAGYLRAETDSAL